MLIRKIPVSFQKESNRNIGKVFQDKSQRNFKWQMAAIKHNYRSVSAINTADVHIHTAHTKEGGYSFFFFFLSFEVTKERSRGGKKTDERREKKMVKKKTKQVDEDFANVCVESDGTGAR